MASETQQPGDNRFVVPRFKGLNERLKYVNFDAAEQDILTGWIQQTSGILERANGIQLLQKIGTGRILNIHQTFDNRENVIVQTDIGVYIFSENELFNRASTVNLTPVTLLEEEDMARALIYHTQASGTNGGTIGAGSTWTTAPLNQLVEQLNPDGSAAAFVTALAAGVFTLAAGTYRFDAKCMHSDNGGNSLVRSRLFNVTTALPAWDTLQNEESLSQRVNDGFNAVTQFQGSLVLAAPTQFRIEYWSSTATDTSGFGRAANTGSPEVYIILEILKTA